MPEVTQHRRQPPSGCVPAVRLTLTLPELRYVLGAVMAVPPHRMADGDMHVALVRQLRRLQVDLLCAAAAAAEDASEDASSH